MASAGPQFHNQEPPISHGSVFISVFIFSSCKKYDPLKLSSNLTQKKKKLSSNVD